jgi:tetratricopeptide (TPR) repeat protein/tRNA A-37 threonylcarbamoyl transferase component Bud32
MKCPKCQAENPETVKFCGECGTPLEGHSRDARPDATKTLQTPINELTTGATFAGRYQVIEELGHGGMGRVYKVFDTKIKEKIALKLIRPEVASDRDTIERFSNEIRLSRKISHRNVCRMFDIGEAEGAHFITMEYVHGEDLKSMIHMSGSLSLGMLLSVGKQVCDGLAEAHSLGVVHRDLKPQNIMIDKNGNAKIMDFGIARSIREKGITGPSVMIGTPEYMSPEQAEAEDVDHRSDIYSLGVILYEMGTSRVPFEGETALSVAMKHKGEVPKDPRQLNPGIPDDLSGVILKCLEKDREKRYQSAAGVRSELEKIEKGIPTAERFVPEPKPITSRQITVQFSPKKLMLPGLAAALIIAAAIVFWKVLPHRKAALAPSGNPSVAILYFENISADPSLDDWKTGLTELLITDLSQSRYINVLSSDRIYGLLKRLGLEQAKKYSSEDLIKVAEEGRVTYTGSGSIMKAGENIIITFALRKPQTAESIPPHKLECRGEGEIASKVDELTRLIKADLNLTGVQISTDPDKRVGEITTSSPEARRFYIEGRKLNDQGDFSQSIEFYKKAIALDPEFAMAWKSMAASYSNRGNIAESDRSLKKALEFSDRVSERERLLIQAQAGHDIEKAIEISRKLIELYPDDRAGHQMLGISYLAIEEWDKAQEPLEWFYRAETDNPIAISNLTDLYRARGRYDKAKQILDEFRRTFPDNLNFSTSLVLYHLCVGELDKALLEADRAFSLSPTDQGIIGLKGDILLCRGELEKAEVEYRKLINTENPVPSIWGRFGLWTLDLLRGRFRQGLNELAQALELAQRIEPKYHEISTRSRLSYTNFSMGRLSASLEEAEKAEEIAKGVGPHWTTDELVQHWTLRPLLLKGLSYLRMGSLEKASRAADDIGALNLYPAERRWHLYLIGLIELGKKNDIRAIEYLKEALSLDPHQWGADNTAFFTEALARAYFQSGDLEKARKQYEEITRLTTGRTHYGDIYAKSFYSLGRIFEQKGDKLQARENYQKFLDLWKDADPGLPEVGDAKKRLWALGT